MAKQEEQEKVKTKAMESAEDKLLDILLPKPRKEIERDTEEKREGILEVVKNQPANPDSTREKLRRLLRKGKLDERYVELEVSDKSFPLIEIFSSAGLEEMDINVKEIFGQILPSKTKKRKVKVKEAVEIITQQESQKLIDFDKVVEKAIRRTEQNGIIFLDELDKIVGSDSRSGPDVSREGVQRDLLPIVEGSTVLTKYGMVKTDHILFIASGAFHGSKPSDLLPELQGRFPIRVELNPLTQEDFVMILTEPQNALIIQYEALLFTEGIRLNFTKSAIAQIAKMAFGANETMENIGARRLHTIMEALLDDISFNASDTEEEEITIDRDYVKGKLSEILEDINLSRYIL
jgi:ATP-dependent HslUV protease ATP-binding subunit HslU